MGPPAGNGARPDRSSKGEAMLHIVLLLLSLLAPFSMPQAPTFATAASGGGWDPDGVHSQTPVDPADVGHGWDPDGLDIGGGWDPNG
jgi:hypothetical protein